MLAVIAVLGSVLSRFDVRQLQASASDFKTVYASAQCFRQHLDPYSFPSITSVFEANGVVSPTSWYGHSPVYPPFTLAAIAPFTLIPMVQGVYLWMAITGLFLVLAAFLLARAGGKIFGLTLPWRLALIALFAASPLLRFSLMMGNVSALVSALSIVAVILCETSPGLGVVSALALTAALLLKPHLAFWVVLALVLSHRLTSRRVALASVGLFVAALLCIALWMAAHHQLGSEVTSYRAMVQQEVAGGSMQSSNREHIAVAAQITSLDSLVAYWLTGLPLILSNAALLLAAFAALIFWSVYRNQAATCPILLEVAAWSGFGLLATYHRAHDGIILLVLLPWLLSRLRTSSKDPAALAVFCLLLVMGSGPSAKAYLWLIAKPGLAHIAQLLLFRQSSIAAALLLALLIVLLFREDSRPPHLRGQAPASIQQC